MENKHTPIRKCICCNDRKPQNELIRLVLDNGNEVKLNQKKILFGKGAYICNSEKCFDILIKKSVLSRAFRKNVSQKEHEKLRGELIKWKAHSDLEKI